MKDDIGARFHPALWAGPRDVTEGVFLLDADGEDRTGPTKHEKAAGSYPARPFSCHVPSRQRRWYQLNRTTIQGGMQAARRTNSAAGGAAPF